MTLRPVASVATSSAKPSWSLAGLRARKVLGWPKIRRLAHAFLWEHSDKRLKLAQHLGQLGVFLTWSVCVGRRVRTSQHLTRRSLHDDASVPGSADGDDASCISVTLQLFAWVWPNRCPVTCRPAGSAFILKRPCTSSIENR